MSPTEQKQQFSFAHIRAVSTVAGISVTKPDVDDDSVDLILKQRTATGPHRSPLVEVQVKCTADDLGSEALIPFPLELKNYNELRFEGLVPRILVVVSVPTDLPDWLHHSGSHTILRNCGYWVSLKGLPATVNTTSVTVYLPREQMLSPSALTAMMERVRLTRNV